MSTSTTTQPLVGTFVADQAVSSFSFTVKHLGINLFRGYFDNVDAQVVADEQGITLVGSARVESISIRHPEPMVEHVVYGADFFDARNHPEITFRSSDVQLADDGTAVVNGELTIKGITKPFSATGTYQPVIESPYGTRGAIELVATVDRREWDLSWQDVLPNGSDAVAYAVEIRTSVEFIKESE